MQQLACSIAILAVAVVYCFWRSYSEAIRRRQRRLRERVAYLLWVVADMETELTPAATNLLDSPLDAI